MSWYNTHMVSPSLFGNDNCVLPRIHMAWVPIASMANLCGISTAPAVKAAFEKQWMPHAIVLAILSMVSGTAWGLFTTFLFGLLQPRNI